MMKPLLTLLILICATYHSIGQQQLNIMTFNIRYQNTYDSLNGWDYRKAKLCSQIHFHEVDILGVQEALYNQMQDLKSCLTEYEAIGVGREDGKEKGEYAAIFIQKSKFKVLKSGTFWLSETPSIAGSKSWDAALTRICTWAEVECKNDHKKIYLFNTHFDHIGRVSRANSGHLIVHYIDSIAGKQPAILTGDLNTTPQEEAVAAILDPNNICKLFDTKAISIEPHYGPTGTFNAFQSHETSDQPIDYIFVTQNFKVLKHATLSQSWQGRFSSDHFPVFARLALN